MALHDDVDDANDANDETSSQEEFNRLFAPRAASPTPPDSSAGTDETAVEDTSSDEPTILNFENDIDDTDDLGVDEFADNFGGSTFDLDEALGDDGFASLPPRMDAPAPPAPTVPTPLDSFGPPTPPSPPVSPPVSAAGSAPIDLNLEFQQSEAGSGSDESVPPWLMAPAPDPNQAVSQLSAPDGLSDTQRSALPEDESFPPAPGGSTDGETGISDVASSAPEDAQPTSAADEDPYQIPSDYITPDYFASKVRRRMSPDAPLPPEADAMPEDVASSPDETQSVPETDDFESLLGFERADSDMSVPETVEPQEPSTGTEPDGFDLFTVDDTEPESQDGPRDSESTDEAPANVWKLGPLEPNPTGAPTPAPTSAPTSAADEPEATPAAVADDLTVEPPASADDDGEADFDARTGTDNDVRPDTVENAADGFNAAPAVAEALADAPAPAPETLAAPAGDDYYSSLFEEPTSPPAALASEDSMPVSESPSHEIDAGIVSESDSATPLADLPDASSDWAAAGESMVPPMPSAIANEADNESGDNREAPAVDAAAHEESEASAETHAFSLDDLRAHFESSEEQVSLAADSPVIAAAPHDSNADSDVESVITPATPAFSETPVSEEPLVADASPTVSAGAAAESTEAPEFIAAEPETSAPSVEIPPRPIRRSMADDELLTWVDNPENQSTGTLSVIEVLEAQLRLREQEANEYREWETTLRAKAGPVADEVIEEVRPQFSDVIATERNLQAKAPQPAREPSPPEARETPEAPEAPEASAASEPLSAPATLPAWDVPPPSENWAPGEDFDSEIPFAAHADPTGSITLPSEDEISADSAETLGATAVDGQEATHDSAAAVGDQPGPVGDQPAPGFDPQSGFLSLDDVVTQASPEYPADEDGDYEEQPFTPPPLVEPEAAPTTPRSNLDEFVSFGDFGFTPPIAEADGEPAVDPLGDRADVAGNRDDDGDPQVQDEPFDFGLNVQGDEVDSSGYAAAPDSAGEALDESQAHEGAAAEEVEQVASSLGDPIVPGAFNFASSEVPRHVASPPLSFDDLLKSETDENNEHDDEPEASPLDELLADYSADAQLDPLSAAATGSIPINQAAFEAELDDVVDDGGFDRDDSADPNQSSTDTEGAPFAAAAAATAAPLSSVAAGTAAATVLPQPLASSTASVGQQPLGLDETTATAQRVFSLEESGLEATPIDRRVGHAARLFWLWFAANSSIVSVGLGAAVFAVGMSLRQSIVSILAGVALSFIPLGLTTLASKRSGQPTMVVSRATFGLVGNVAPSVVALVARLFWGAVLLWVLASSVAIVVVGSDLNAGLGDRQLLLLSLAGAFLVALVIAFAGYPLFARIQLVLSIISGLLIAGLIGLTAQYIDVAQALTVPDSSWLLTITGTVLVFSFLGLVWAFSGGDLARYQRPSSSGPGAMLSATFGATLPAFVLIAYGALLAASDPALARGFLASPLDTLLLLLPGWYPIPLLLAAALSLLSGVILSLYSGGFALQAVGIRVPRQWSIVIVGVILGALAVLFAFGISGGINELFRDVATTLAVPTAAWAGIFAVETMIRTRRLDGASLTTRGGIYADVRWFNLGAFVVISAIGFALTSATISWLSWQGYGFSALGVDRDSLLAQTDLGVLVALGLGLLAPLVAGIPAIRRQEAAQAERVPSRT